jgi:16S rRNA (cytosine1402-N4)-methyltransferase
MDGPTPAVHRPVLLAEALELLNVRPEGVYVDATLGGGGHAEALAKRLTGGKLLGIDRDPVALDGARRRLQPWSERLVLMKGNFAEIGKLHAASGLPPADGLLADLGVSSLQLEDAARGFSFNLPGPLDMRMDPETPVTAQQLVNEMRERELADLIFRLGEERYSRRIARAIVEARPIRTTTHLAQVVMRVTPVRAGFRHLHPATRTFMALRLAVNREIENLEAFLQGALAVLDAGGRVVIVSFHSLEDGMVKRAFQSWRREGRARLLTRNVVRPTESEVRANPRARSAKLRAAEKTVSQ